MTEWGKGDHRDPTYFGLWWEVACETEGESEEGSIERGGEDSRVG